MRRTLQRGHALPLTMAALTALSILAGVVWARIATEREGRMALERRTQLLWLVRSAAAGGRPGTRVVLISREQVKVNTRVWQLGAVTRIAADATLIAFGTARAEVLVNRSGEVVDWRERYERVLVPPAKR